jgi:hypothetical protein
VATFTIRARRPADSRGGGHRGWGFLDRSADGRWCGRPARNLLADALMRPCVVEVGAGSSGERHRSRRYPRMGRVDERVPRRFRSRSAALFGTRQPRRGRAIGAFSAHPGRGSTGPSHDESSGRSEPDGCGSHYGSCSRRWGGSGGGWTSRSVSCHVSRARSRFQPPIRPSSTGSSPRTFSTRTPHARTKRVDSG